MNFRERLLTKPTPVHHFHHYIAMPAAYNRKKSWMIFDSDSFDVGIDSMDSTCKSPQKAILMTMKKFNLDNVVEYEEI